MQVTNLRAATLSDLPILLEFEQKILEAERPYNSDIKPDNAFYYDLEELISEATSQLLVAEAKQGVVASGYAQIHDSKQAFNHEQHAYFGFMYVKPEYRGCGLNKKILDSLISWSKARGVSNGYLDVYSQNQSAIKAYEKAGFVNLMNQMSLHFT